MKPVVSARDVSKRFVIRHERNRSFQDAFVSIFRSRGRAEQFWALRDVSFDLEPGQTLGVIGSNGSGKSTLLKIITRILEPTNGKVVVNGKVSALLELGAGFHPDLSGRDNVYLNGSLLGINRRTMDKRFDEIVSFAGLEQFIDTRVRHYSSGMYVRLAFAVAINVDAEFLIVDEVLAVGDQGFQDKCFGKIHELRRQGVAILLVSHALSSVQSLCDRVMWLDCGKVQVDGPADDAISHYLVAVHDQEEQALASQQHTTEQSIETLRQGSGAALLSRVQIGGSDGRERHVFAIGEPMVVSAEYIRKAEIAAPLILVASIRRDDGVEVHRTSSGRAGALYDPDAACGLIVLRYPELALGPGSYTLSLSLAPSDDPSSWLDHHDGLYPFTVRASGETDGGIVALRREWSGTVVDPDARKAEVEYTEVDDPSYVAPGQEGAQRYLSGTWHAVENNGFSYRWMGRRASVRLAVRRTPAQLGLTVRNLLADAVPELAPSRGEVFADGVVIGRFSLNGPEPKTFLYLLPVDAPRSVHVTIVLDAAIVPAEVGLGPDPRELGVTVDEVWIE